MNDRHPTPLSELLSSGPVAIAIGAICMVDETVKNVKSVLKEKLDLNGKPRKTPMTGDGTGARKRKKAIDASIKFCVKNKLDVAYAVDLIHDLSESGVVKLELGVAASDSLKFRLIEIKASQLNESILSNEKIDSWVSVL